jgi:hypothetical protein
MMDKIAMIKPFFTEEKVTDAIRAEGGMVVKDVYRNLGIS